MKSHELATLLLELPNFPVATYALDNIYNSVDDRYGHGAMKIGLLKEYYCNGGNDYIIIGNLSIKNIDNQNAELIEVFYEDE